MKVSIIFDKAFDGKASQAVWLVDSAGNRLWLNRCSGTLDPNSALFRETTPVMNIIWSAQEHHPSWMELDVIGLPLTADLTASLADEGVVEPVEGGFRLLRR